MVPAPLVQRFVGCCAAVTVDRVDQVANDPTQLFGSVLTRDIDEFGFDLGDALSAFRRARVRDHRRVPSRNLSAFERSRHDGEAFQLARQLDVPACDALVDTTRRPKRRRRIEEPVGCPFA